MLYQNEQTKFFQKSCNSQFQPPLILLRPLYLVLNWLIHIFSLCFLYWGFWLKTFSMMVSVISLTLCPCSLKCFPVALLRFLVVTYPLCSKNLSLTILSVSPMYCWVHFLHPIKYNYRTSHWSISSTYFQTFVIKTDKHMCKL